MSYINDSLKKAQKEKDIRHIRYSSVIEGSRKEKQALGGKAFWGSLALLVLIILVFTSYSWLDLSVGNIVPATEFKGPAQIKQYNGGIDTKDLYDKAGNLLKSGRFQDAKKSYEEALGLDPGYVDALNNLGVIYMRDKDYSTAKRSFEKAILLKPVNAEPYYNLACLHAIKGEGKQGLVYLKKAVSLDKSVREWVRNDSDLENLRVLHGFKEMMSE
ncbi:type IV pilus biogenesis/stability protein PilW [Thermodesulfobacteriota bacterium]